MTRLKEPLLQKLKQNKAFILFIIFLFSIRWSFADHYRVPSGSMLPTIQIGDHVFVNKMAYDLKLPFTDIVLAQTGSPKRGDIIVFKYPKDPSLNYVKRLVAIPGDHVEIYNGFIKINGQITLKTPQNFHKIADKLFTSQTPFEYKESIGTKEFTVRRLPYRIHQQKISFTVPAHRYFFMGDNRDNSLDGRYWGFVSRDYLKGRAKRVTMSIAFDGIIPKVNFFRFGKELI